MQPSQVHSARRHGRGGFTLIELLTAVTVLVFGIGALVTIVATTSAANRVNYETALAHSAALGVIERMGAEPFSEIFARYNLDEADDPDGNGTAPGASFAVLGLEARADDPDGLPGEILLPSGGPELWEDEDAPLFGLPRDLDLDGFVDGLDHSGDYHVLPVIVRIRWHGHAGPRDFELTASLSDL